MTNEDSFSATAIKRADEYISLAAEYLRQDSQYQLALGILQAKQAYKEREKELASAIAIRDERDKRLITMLDQFIETRPEYKSLILATDVRVFLLTGLSGSEPSR